MTTPAGPGSPGGGAVLVTGARGSVGSHVVAELVARGVAVRAAYTRPAGAVLPAGAEPVAFDFTAPAGWPAALTGVDRLFLMRPPAISDVRSYLRPVIRLAADRGVRHVVFLSLLGVNRLMPHWRVERDIEAAGLSHTFLRPGFFAQNLLTAYAGDIRDHDRIRLPAGRGKTAFVDTRDVAAVAAGVLADPAAYPEPAYPLTGAEALTWAAVASLLTAELGRPIRYEPSGLLRYRRELLAGGADPTYVRVQLGINLVARLGLAARINGELPRLLDRPPRRLAEFVRDYRSAWLPNS